VDLTIRQLPVAEVASRVESRLDPLAYVVGVLAGDLVEEAGTRAGGPAESGGHVRAAARRPLRLGVLRAGAAALPEVDRVVGADRSARLDDRELVAGGTEIRRRFDCLDRRLRGDD